MGQLTKLFNAIPVRQRVLIGVLTAVVGIGIYFFIQWERDHNFRPLYTALSAEDAGTVVQKLRTSNVEYRLAENGTSVLVPSEKVAELRLELASAGLPKSGRIGFELFDRTNFGMTEFTEHVNYRRALEGELERSVMSLAEVELARVHITFPKESVFTESRQPAKASVLVKLRANSVLPTGSVGGITNLVASAVEGLLPTAVSVMDMRGNLLNRARLKQNGDESDASEAVIEYRQGLEKNLMSKMRATLEPLVGADKFRATASVDCDLTSGDQSDETYDPDKTVVASTQKSQDRQTTGGAAEGGQPGVASNLPRPPAQAADSGDGSSHTTEQTTYQTSRTVRHTKIPQGVVTKISAAVLLDQGVRWEGTGKNARKVLVPVPQETIDKIRELISAAVGLNTERGDNLIVESLPFESTLNLEMPEMPASATPAAKTPAKPVEWWKEHQLLFFGGGGGTLAVIALAVIFVLRKMRRKSKVSVSSEPAGNELNAPAGAEIAAASNLQPAAAVSASAQLPAAGTSPVELLAAKIRDAAKTDQEVFAKVLRRWLAEEAHS